MLDTMVHNATPHGHVLVVPPPSLPLFAAEGRRASYRGRRSTGSLERDPMQQLEPILGRDVGYRKRLREVLRRQRALRRCVSAVGWRAYLTLEEAEFDRWAYALERVARWAHARGRRRRAR